MKILPAPADTGIVFVRTDVECFDNVIPARLEFISDTELCTRLANNDGISVSTVEHALAGLAACGVHNAVIEADGDELPALDGSALEFVKKILATGVRDLDEPVRIIKILKPVEVSVNGARAVLEPSRRAEMYFEIDFPNPIGAQNRSMDLSNGAIVRNLTGCRTFVLRPQIAELQRRGFGLGGTEKNVIIADVRNSRFICELRHPDEPCGHKMLDAVGDLSLAGYPVIGRFKGYRSGHGTTATLLKKLFSERDAFSISFADTETASELPGAGAAFRDIPRF